MRSFDASRDRSAPTTYEGITLSGVPVTGTFARRHLIVAAKPDCDGCRALLESEPSAFGPVPVLVVGAEATDEPWWHESALPVIISPSLMAAMDIRWPPFWVLVDGESGRVLNEGVPFGPEHIAKEIADLL